LLHGGQFHRFSRFGRLPPGSAAYVNHFNKKHLLKELLTYATPAVRGSRIIWQLNQWNKLLDPVHALGRFLAPLLQSILVQKNMNMREPLPILLRRNAWPALIQSESRGQKILPFFALQPFNLNEICYK
jgi:hypothetical protein